MRQAGHGALRRPSIAVSRGPTRFRKGLRAGAGARRRSGSPTRLDDEVRWRTRAQMARRSSAGSSYPEAPPLPLGRRTRRPSWRGGSSCRRRPRARRHFAPSRGERPCVVRARSRGVARAREPRSARASGAPWVEFWGGRWELAADARGAGARYLDPVRPGGAPGSPADRASSRPPDSSSSRGSIRDRALGLSEEQFALHPPQHQAVLGARRGARGDHERRRCWLGGGGPAARRALRWREPSVRWWTRDRVERPARGGRARRSRAGSSTPGRLTPLRVGRQWVLAHVSAVPGSARGRPGGRRRAAASTSRRRRRARDGGDPFGQARAFSHSAPFGRRDRQKARPAPRSRRRSRVRGSAPVDGP